MPAKQMLKLISLHRFAVYLAKTDGGMASQRDVGVFRTHVTARACGPPSNDSRSPQYASNAARAHGTSRGQRQVELLASAGRHGGIAVIRGEHEAQDVDDVLARFLP